jgi:hypothetical protein
MVSYRVIITQTGRNSMKEKPDTFNEESKLFKSLEDAKAYVKEKYGKVKTKKPMFIDGADGKPKKIGYIFGFWNQDMSHSGGNKWFQEDWVEIRTESYDYPKW